MDYTLDHRFQCCISSAKYGQLYPCPLFSVSKRLAHDDLTEPRRLLTRSHHLAIGRPINRVDFI